MAERLKGQETEIRMVSSTQGLLSSFSDVQSFSITFQREVLDEGYVGQPTNQKDDIFNGVSFDMTIHSRTASVIDLIQRMNEVSKGRLPGESFQIASTLRFADGTRRIILRECAFGEIPINVGGRGEYVEFSLSGQASDGSFVAG